MFVSHSVHKYSAQGWDGDVSGAILRESLVSLPPIGCSFYECFSFMLPISGAYKPIKVRLMAFDSLNRKEVLHIGQRSLW